VTTRLISGLFTVWLFLVSLFVVTRLTNYLPLRLLAVTSPSMQPALPSGSLVITTPQDHYAVGDIVSFRPDPTSSTVITHRIIGFRRDNLLTAGDANAYTDNFDLLPEQIVGQVRFSFPLVGFFISLASTFTGFFLSVFLPTLILLYINSKHRLLPIFPRLLPKTAFALCLFSSFLLPVELITSYFTSHRVSVRTPVIISAVPTPEAKDFAKMENIFPPAQTLRLDTP
jgi:signal peptidase I